MLGMAAEVWSPGSLRFRHGWSVASACRQSALPGSFAHWGGRLHACHAWLQAMQAKRTEPPAACRDGPLPSSSRMGSMPRVSTLKRAGADAPGCWLVLQSRRPPLGDARSEMACQPLNAGLNQLERDCSHQWPFARACDGVLLAKMARKSVFRKAKGTHMPHEHQGRTAGCVIMLKQGSIRL